MKTILILLLFISDIALKGNTYEEHIDLIELNHMYNPKGEAVFDQLIYWERQPNTGKFHVRAWKMFGQDVSLDTFEKVTVRYYDQDGGVYRILRSKLYRESWTQVDPERNDQKEWPEQMRVGLAKPIKEIKDEK